MTGRKRFDCRRWQKQFFFCFSLPCNRWQRYISRIMWPEREAAYLFHFSLMFSSPSAASTENVCYFKMCVYWLHWFGSETGCAAKQLSTRVSSGIKRPEREFEYSVSSVIAVKNEWGLFLLTQYAFIASTASNLPFLLLFNFGNWANILWRILCLCNVEW